MVNSLMRKNPYLSTSSAQLNIIIRTITEVGHQIMSIASISKWLGLLCCYLTD